MSTQRSQNTKTRPDRPLQTEQLSVPGLPEDFWSGTGGGRSASPPSKRA
jgi:hypothetical protein